MQYLKNKYKIDFEKNCRQDCINSDTGLQTTLPIDHLFSCDEINKHIRETVNESMLDYKKSRFRELFHSITINAERETEEIVGYLTNSINGFYISPVEYIWLKNVISIVEHLPICVTIASARKEFFGFPLIYVNKQFETTTEYRRKDIIGKNCKFLQPSIPLPDEEIQHRIIKQSIKSGLPTSVIITNVKKGGNAFHNLISLQSINDKDGNYLYNLGIQLEITATLINKEDIQNIIDLMQILAKVKINVISPT